MNVPSRRMGMLVTLAACSGSQAPSLSHYADEVSASVDVLQAELMEHHEEALAQTDLDALRALEEHHMDAMVMSMRQMEEAQGSLDFCNARLDVTTEWHDAAASLEQAADGMHEAMDAGDEESQHHWRAMHAASDLEEAYSEEHRHEAAAIELLDRLSDHEAHMMSILAGMDGGHMMMCPMSTHMHGSR